MQNSFPEQLNHRHVNQPNIVCSSAPQPPSTTVTLTSHLLPLVLEPTGEPGIGRPPPSHSSNQPYAQ